MNPAVASPGPNLDVVLVDGRSIHIRAVAPGDGDAIIALLDGLAAEELHARFGGSRATMRRYVDVLTADDAARTGDRGLVVVDESGSVVALGSWLPLPTLHGTHPAEAAVHVARRWRRRGIAVRLLEQLAFLARADGITEFIAEVETSNVAMLAALRDLGFEQHGAGDRQSTQVALSLEPAAGFLAAYDHRNHLATRASLSPLLASSGIVLAGASASGRGVGCAILRNLESSEAVPIGVVHPTAHAVLGHAAVPAFADIEHPWDIAVLCVPAEAVLPCAEQALDAGARIVCVVSAGFAEAGDDGRERQLRLVELVRAHGARLIGPNCLGFVRTPDRINATFASRPFPAGNIACASQSGALGIALLERAASRGFGFSSFVSLGNKADVTSSDLLELWEDDDATDAVLLYLESFDNPRRLLRVARRVGRVRPIIALQGGVTRSGVRAAGSHTAAIASARTLTDALFEDAGLIRATDLGEFIDLAAYVASAPLPTGNRLAIVTNAGGLGILAADAAEQAGLELATFGAATNTRLQRVLSTNATLANPVDLLGSAGHAEFEHAVVTVLSDADVDSVLVAFTPTSQLDVDAVGAAIAAAADRAAADAGSTRSKPLLAVFLSDHAPASLRADTRRIPTFPLPEAAARTLGRVTRYAARRAVPDGTMPVPDVDLHEVRAILDDARAVSPDGWLGARAVAALLTVLGIPQPESVFTDDPEEAADAADRWGGPVAVKLAPSSSGIHKTDVGGVLLDLHGRAAVAAAVARLGADCVVQPMVAPGVELIAGLVSDERFGPVLGLGIGGTTAELLPTMRFRLAPLTARSVDELLAAAPTARVLAGFRGAPPCDVEAVRDVMRRLSLLAFECPSVAQVALNPLVCGAAGCIAVDARVRIAPPSASALRW